jgi:hypothetical protein
MLYGSAHRAPATDDAVILDVERLDAYVVALGFQKLTARLARKLGGPFRDQLERASLSIVLNLAEGVGRTQPADKARYYAISAAVPASVLPWWTSCAPEVWPRRACAPRPDVFSCVSCK